MAGFLSVTTLANPLVGLTVLRVPWVAALATALIGLGAGHFLRRRCQDEPSMASTGARWVHLLGVLMVAGPLSGATVGVAGTLGTYGPLPSACVYAAAAGAVGGAACALLFAPTCAWVLASARAAKRARHGSIVAGSDGRAVWGILATALALATLLAILDWQMVADGTVAGIEPPYPAAAVALAGWVMTVALLLADILARLRLGRVAAAAATMEERASESASVVEGNCRVVDFGVGEGHLARVTRGAAYRGRERVTALLIGSAADARAALRRALELSLGRLLATSAVLAVHIVAAGSVPAATLAPVGRLDRPAGWSPGASALVQRIEASARPACEHGYPASLRGRIAPEDVQRVVRSASPRLAQCTAPDAPRVRMSVRFVIELDGRVREATVSSPPVAPAVTRCVQRHFTELVFPRPEGGCVTVAYPILIGS